MQVNICLQGVEQFQRTLAAAGRKIDPVLRGALNTTATKARAERYTTPLRPVLKPKFVRSAMKIKRARRGMMNSRIIPSSSGVPVTRYAGWGFDPVDRTRARLWVRGPNGRKVAAGFVNPASVGKQPWRTRGVKRAGTLQPALGPSVAYWFKSLTDQQTITWISDFLQREFEARLQKELAKGAR